MISEAESRHLNTPYGKKILINLYTAMSMPVSLTHCFIGLRWVGEPEDSYYKGNVFAYI